MVLSEKQILKVANEIEKINPKQKDNINDFFDFFDPYWYEAFVSIEENAKKFTKEEWLDLYKTYRDEPCVLYDMLYTRQLPVDIVEKIANNISVLSYESDDTYSSDVKRLELDMVKEILRYEGLPDKFVSDIINKLEPESLVNMFRNFSYWGRTAGNYLLSPAYAEFPQKTLEKITKRCISNIPALGPSELCQLHSLDVALLLKNKEMLKEIVSEDLANNTLNDGAKIAIINNFYLDENNPEDAQIISNLYSLDLPLQFLYRMPPTAKQELFSYFLETLKESSDIPTIQNTLQQVNFGIENGLIPPDFELGLLDVLMSNKLEHEKKNDVIISIFERTKNQATLDRFVHLSPELQATIITTRKDIPKDLLKDFLTTKTLESFLDGKNPSAEMYKAITKCLQTIKPTTKQYNEILNSDIVFLKREIASSPVTSANMLTKLLINERENFFKKPTDYAPETSVIIACLLNLYKKDPKHNERFADILDIYSNSVYYKSSLEEYQKTYKGIHHQKQVFCYKFATALKNSNLSREDFIETSKEVQKHLMDISNSIPNSTKTPNENAFIEFFPEFISGNSRMIYANINSHLKDFSHLSMDELDDILLYHSDVFENNFPPLDENFDGIGYSETSIEFNDIAQILYKAIEEKEKLQEKENDIGLYKTQLLNER